MRVLSDRLFVGATERGRARQMTRVQRPATPAVYSVRRWLLSARRMLNAPNATNNSTSVQRSDTDRAGASARAVQKPTLPGAVHVWFGPVQASVQQTPLTQNPDAHWVPVVQLSPSPRGRRRRWRRGHGRCDRGGRCRSWIVNLRKGFPREVGVRQPPQSPGHDAVTQDDD